jgi:hypothetical protein
MTTDAFTERLSEYLDGELTPRDRAEIDRHLTICASCRTTLEELREVVARAGRLVATPPDADLWPGVAHRVMSAQDAPSKTLTFARRAPRRFSFTLPQLAAAGIALMVLSGGLVWLARAGYSGADVPATEARVVNDSAAPSLRPANFSDPHYDEAVADLQRTLDAGRKKLDPQTVRVLETNLAAIDEAIDQCRKALAGDPANVYLNSHLAEARQRKLMLLRRASALATGT